MNREALIELKAKVEAGEPCRTWGATLTDFAGAKWNEVYLAFNGSLDAAKALHEAVLPEWGWLINGFRSWVTVWAEGDRTSDANFNATCINNPARAWLLAILSALIAMEPDREEERETEEGY